MNYLINLIATAMIFGLESTSKIDEKQNQTGEIGEVGLDRLVPLAELSTIKPLPADNASWCGV